MTIDEAKSNIYRPVTAVNQFGDRYNGKIQEANEPENLVRVNFGDGNLGPSFWYCPEDLSFGWTGEEFKPIDVAESKPAPNLSDYVAFNLNQSVLVKLDDKAFGIWKRHDDATLDFAPEDIRARLIKPLKHYTSKVRPDGYVEMPFYQLMEVFGYYCRIGYEVFSMQVRLYKTDVEQL